MPDSTRGGWLTALDAENGAVRWRWHSAAPLVAGVTATAGGVVFTGDLVAGTFYAFEARTGTVLYRYALGRPIGGGVVSYLANGRQHVAVAAGMHAPATWKVKSAPGAVVVVRLP